MKEVKTKPFKYKAGTKLKTLYNRKVPEDVYDNIIAYIEKVSNPFKN